MRTWKYSSVFCEVIAINYYVTKLLNFALDQGIAIQLTSDLSPDAVSIAFPNRRMIIINSNWRDQTQLPFVVAHEIGHIMNGDPTIAYFHPSKTKVEAGANQWAVNELLELYCQDVDQEHFNQVRFMECFHIPDYLNDYIAEVVPSHYK